MNKYVIICRSKDNTVTHDIFILFGDTHSRKRNKRSKSATGSEEPIKKGISNLMRDSDTYKNNCRTW
jgi:hypothetical protein